MGSTVLAIPLETKAVVSVEPIPPTPAVDPVSTEPHKAPEVTQQLSLDSIRLMRLRKKTPSARASPETPNSRQPSRGAPSGTSSSSGIQPHSTASEVATRLELPRRVQPEPTQVQKRPEKSEGNSEEEAAPAVRWRRPRGRPRKDRSQVVLHGPSPSPSPSQGDASEQEIVASVLEDDDTPVSYALMSRIRSC